MYTSIDNAVVKFPEKQTVKVRPKFNLQNKKNDPVVLLKKGIWLYFLLLIFEGALRKWVLPGLASPLLLIRDPIALAIILTASYYKLLPSNIYMNVIIAVGFISIFTAILVGHGNILVALYGARIFLFHFPLMFVAGRVFDRDDVIKMGRFIMLISIPLTVLIALQFFSPQSAWVNRGVGGTMEGGGFGGGANGFLRPPGTFSFTNGNALFYSLVAPFVFYFWLNPKNINKIVLIGATVALIVSVPLSISRSLFFQLVVSLLFAIIAASRKPKYIGKMVAALIGGILVITLLSQIDFFKVSTEAFTARFEGANESEGGLNSVLADRYLGGMIGAITGSAGIPVFGYGVGMGSSVGGMLLQGDTVRISEDDWSRQIAELGIVLGLAVIFVRLLLSAKIFLLAYQKLSKGDLLPWMLLSFGLLIVPQGEWAQPTSLGFSTLIGGLMMGSLRQSMASRLKPANF